MNLFGPLRVLRHKFMADATTLQVSAMINQVGQLASSMLIAFLLGAHGQGLYFLAVSLQALFYNMINVGVVQATITQVAAASVRDQRPKVAGWLAFVVKSNLVFSLLMIGVGWFVLPLLSEWWYTDKVGQADALSLGRWAWWLTFYPLIDTPRMVSQVAFQSTRRMVRLAHLDNGSELIRLVLVTGGAALTGSAQGAILGELVSRVLSSYLALDVYRAAHSDGGAWLPHLRDVFAQTLQVPLIQGIRLGLRVGALKNATTLFVEVLPGLVLGGMAGASWVAYFRVASKIMGVPMMLLQGVSRTILPALSELRGLRDLDRFRTLYTRTTLLSGSLVTAGLVLMLFFVKPLVRQFWPADFADPVFTYSWILTLGLIPLAFAVGLDALFILTDQMRRSLMIMGVGTVLTVSANVILMALLPETGPAWGTTASRSYVLIPLAYGSWYLHRHAARGHWDR